MRKHDRRLVTSLQKQTTRPQTEGLTWILYPAKQHVELQYQNPVVVDRRYRNRLVHLSNDLPSSYFRAPKQLRDTEIGHQI